MARDETKNFRSVTNRAHLVFFSRDFCRAALSDRIHPRKRDSQPFALSVRVGIQLGKCILAASHDYNGHHGHPFSSCCRTAGFVHGNLSCGIRKSRQPVGKAGARHRRNALGHPFHRLRAVRHVVFCYGFGVGLLASRGHPYLVDHDSAAHHANGRGKPEICAGRISGRLFWAGGRAFAHRL